MIEALATMIWWLMVAALVAEVAWCIVLIGGLVAVKIIALMKP